MTVKELYEKIEEQIPRELSEEWDNDGLMCSPDTSAEVRRTLVTLDVTEEIVDYAISEGFNLIVSHHPLIFKPIKSVTDKEHISRKLIKLIESGVSVFSFHTRADKVRGGVNDKLCAYFGITNGEPFGEGELGRLGTVEETTLEDFVYRAKLALDVDVIKYSDAYNMVSRVAFVGGDGKDYVKAAIDAGADTFLSGRIGYNTMEEAAELGINLIEAGHYFTEQPITEFFTDILMHLDGAMYIETAYSNTIKYL